MDDAGAAPAASRLARSALGAAIIGWGLLVVAAVIAAARSGPVPREYASDGVSTTIGMLGLAGVLGLIGGVARGSLALLRLRRTASGADPAPSADHVAARGRARWAVALGSTPFVVVLVLGVVALLTLH